MFCLAVCERRRADSERHRRMLRKVKAEVNFSMHLSSFTFISLGEMTLELSEFGDTYDVLEHTSSLCVTPFYIF